jgi:hypothetical protein
MSFGCNNTAGIGVKDTTKYYWYTFEHLCTQFYNNVINCVVFFHVPRYLHFLNNMNQPRETYKNTDKLWKIITPK